MKLQFSSKEKLAIFAVIIILLLYVAIAQFYFLSPLKTNLNSKQQQLASEQKLLSDLSQKANSSNGTEIKNTTELQRQIPVKPLQDQFILDLQQAESVSSSQIKSMSFTENSQNSAANSSNAGATNRINNQQTSDSTSSKNNQSSGTSAARQSQNTQSTTTTGASQPSLNKLTAQLSVESPTYEDFEKFINTIESLKRIAVVENISYTGPSEITSLDQVTKPFDYTLTVSVYYMPSLIDLQSQLPKVDYPPPAEKENPLAQFPDLTTR